MFVKLILFLLIFAFPSIRAGDEDSESPEVEDLSETNELALESMKKLLPSQDALEEVGITFLDALIKAGQIEMAKGAFKTQLGVLKKVQPDQYKKYKNIPISKLAADAVFEQARQVQNQPKTGNRLIDMLHENGIPIGSSLKGIQQAIKTQKEIENSDPAEQVAKAVFEKFQKQILPGLVANMIAGRNPFQLPQRPELRQMTQNQQRMFRIQHEEALKQIQKNQFQKIGKNQFDLTQFFTNFQKPKIETEYEYDSTEEKEDENEEEYETEEESGNSENENQIRNKRQTNFKNFSEIFKKENSNKAERKSKKEFKLFKKFPTFFKIDENKKNEESEISRSRTEVNSGTTSIKFPDVIKKENLNKIKSLFDIDGNFNFLRKEKSETSRSRTEVGFRKKRQTRLADSSELIREGNTNEAELKLGKKAAMLFGIYEQFPDLVENEKNEKKIRRKFNKIPIELAQRILNNERLKSLLSNEELAYKLTDPEAFLEPKKIVEDPNPQPGFVTPRPIPQRPRKMLTLLVGKNTDYFYNSESHKPQNSEESSEYYDDEETPNLFEPFRRHPENQEDSESSSNRNSEVLEDSESYPSRNSEVLEDFNSHSSRNSEVLEDFNSHSSRNSEILEDFNSHSSRNSEVLEDSDSSNPDSDFSSNRNSEFPENSDLSNPDFEFPEDSDFSTPDSSTLETSDFSDQNPKISKKLNFFNRDSRVLKNLKNNPGILTLLENEEIAEKMRKPSVLTDSQRMGVGTPEAETVIRPRMFGIKNIHGKNLKPNKMDLKIKQIIEERNIPPIFYVPRGRHTRLRWTGAVEKEIPGIGSRLILPSLDPTMPAINSVISTQGKSRDEYDSVFKIPNYWNPGDTFGIDAKTVQERLVGGDGTVDFPAMQAGMTFG